MTNEQKNEIRCAFKAAYTSFGPYGVLTEAKKHSMSLDYVTKCWALAMSAHFGPVGIAESRLGADGTPTPETLAQFPNVLARMAEARLRLESLLNNVWH